MSTQKSIGIVSAVAVSLGLLSALWWFCGRRISDRNLLVEAAQEFVKATPPSAPHVPWDVFCQQAAQGYYDDALATIYLSDKDPDTQYALVSLTRIRARNGDVQGALRTVRGYGRADTRQRAIAEIAVAQAESGDAAGARRTAALLEDTGTTLQRIAAVEAGRGDLKGARETVASVTMPNLALGAIGEYQIKSGDFRGALETAGRMSPDATGNLLFDIGDELRRRGETKLVGDLASGITDRKLARVFEEYARLAVSTMEDIPRLKPNPCNTAYFRAEKGEFGAAYELMKGTKCSHALIAIKQYGSDPAGAERALLGSTSPFDTCFGVNELAKAAGANGNVADALRFIRMGENVCVGGGNAYPFGAVRAVARFWTIKVGPRAPVKWARSQTTSALRGVALLGVAEGLGHAHP